MNYLMWKAKAFKNKLLKNKKKATLSPRTLNNLKRFKASLNWFKGFLDR
jgi:hypothetical protein